MPPIFNTHTHTHYVKGNAAADGLIEMIIGVAAAAHCPTSLLSSKLPPEIAVVFPARLKHAFFWIPRFIWLHLVCNN